MSAPLVQAQGLSRSFRARGGLFAGTAEIMAVKEVDLAIGRGEAVGVVGESGCGKTTLGRILLRLIPPSRGRLALKFRRNYAEFMEPRRLSFRIGHASA